MTTSRSARSRSRGRTSSRATSASTATCAVWTSTCAHRPEPKVGLEVPRGVLSKGPRGARCQSGNALCRALPIKHRQRTPRKEASGRTGRGTHVSPSLTYSLTNPSSIPGSWGLLLPLRLIFALSIQRFAQYYETRLNYVFPVSRLGIAQGPEGSRRASGWAPEFHSLTHSRSCPSTAFG